MDCKLWKNKLYLWAENICGYIGKSHQINISIDWLIIHFHLVTFGYEPNSQLVGLDF
jgi:hypothetical protein